MSLERLNEHYTGVALELSPREDFEPEQIGERLKITSLLGRVPGVGQAITRIVALSVLVQVFALIAPVFVQVVIDRAIPTLNVGFLVTLAVSFLGAFVLAAMTSALRSWSSLFLSQSLSFASMGRLVNHLLRLPPHYFERRSVGDVLSRVQSTVPLQALLAEGLPTIVLDGFLAVTMLAVLFVYDPLIGLVVALGGAFSLIATTMIAKIMRVRQDENVVATAREQTHLIETIRAASAVKLFGVEAQRENTWKNRFAHAISTRTSLEQLRILLRFILEASSSLITVLIVAFAATRVMGGQMSIGAMTAVLAYRLTFDGRLTALTTELTRFVLMETHAQRLGDIVQSDPENLNEDELSFALPEVEGAIEFSKVAFRYSETDPLILDDVTFEIPQGAFAVFTGRSGGGKTTLIKLLLAIEQPTAGEIAIDAIPLMHRSIRDWRANVGVVMQNDQLFSGSIAENISFFDPEMDFAAIEEAARMADIHEDIMNKPMGYRSLIGDMGSTLSGGQYQRVLLARALYRKPKVLILDEGTANLDRETEARIADVVQSLDITRIAIAHRPALIERADLHFEVSGGTVVSGDATVNDHRRNLQQV